jgi:predicted  nucleic acid-binding Zn-ribbon protein
VFRCERCGSSYSAVHAVALQNCPRCQIRDKVVSPLSFKAFTLPEEFQRKDSLDGAPAGEEPSRQLAS